MTQLIRGLYNIAPRHTGGVITIGNFDGVHRGHQALIEKIKDDAKAVEGPSIVMTFEPQPIEFFSDKTVARLTRWQEKYCELAQTGVDYVLVIRFDHDFSKLSAQEFIKKILVDALAVKKIIVGDDFRFGHQREGDFHYLQISGKEWGFEVESMPSMLVDGERISSTRIRKALAEDNQALAERLLGHPYQMMGRVVHGDKLGRQLGFPTANIFLHRAVTPVQGIYIVRMHGIGNEPLPGVANVGIRPTVGGTRSLLEVYLFNFNTDIYGRHVRVEFCKKLRAEERYANLDLLKEAIAKDAAQARNYFEERGEL
ncbi:MAG: bifunctional riboflavin kinase/FAD synthetase [Gammaproteobacteria bacterium]